MVEEHLLIGSKSNTTLPTDFLLGDSFWLISTNDLFAYGQLWQASSKMILIDANRCWIFDVFCVKDARLRAICWIIWIHSYFAVSFFSRRSSFKCIRTEISNFAAGRPHGLWQSPVLKAKKYWDAPNILRDIWLYPLVCSEPNDCYIMLYPSYFEDFEALKQSRKVICTLPAKVFVHLATEKNIIVQKGIILSMAISGTDWLEVPTIFLRPIFQA